MKAGGAEIELDARHLVTHVRAAPRGDPRRVPEPFPAGSAKPPSTASTISTGWNA